MNKVATSDVYTDIVLCVNLNPLINFVIQTISCRTLYYFFFIKNSCDLILLMYYYNVLIVSMLCFKTLVLLLMCETGKVWWCGLV